MSNKFILSFNNNKYLNNSFLQKIFFVFEYNIPILYQYTSYKRRINYYKKLLKKYS